MSSSTRDTHTAQLSLSVDPIILEAVIAGTQEGLQMTNLCPPAVGVSCFFTPRNPLSVIIGLVGDSSGSLTLNLSEEGLLFVAGKLIGEEQTTVSEDVIDAMMEIGNLVAGCVKDKLAGSKYSIQKMSLPSVIFGQSYNVLYSRGIQTVSVEFELEDLPFVQLGGRFFTSTVSLLRGSGM